MEEQIMSSARAGTIGPGRQQIWKMEAILGAIREEFVEMPCMRLTRAQFRRLWHLTPAESERLVGDLIALGFLAEDPQGRIGRAQQY
jgi:hypothetical protein